MYLHSIVWFVALLFAARALYRAIHVDRGQGGVWIATLALLLYALDDARGPVVGWISNRNALVMGTFSCACLWAHHRRSVGDSTPVWLAPALLALALAAAEGAVATLGYLVSHAVFLDRAPWKQRVGRLIPSAIVFVVWVVLYKLGGWGTAGSGVYLDPIGDLGAYLRVAPARIVALLVGQLATPWSDFWPAYPSGLEAWMLGAGGGSSSWAWSRAIGVAGAEGTSPRLDSMRRGTARRFARPDRRRRFPPTDCSPWPGLGGAGLASGGRRARHRESVSSDRWPGKARGVC